MTVARFCTPLVLVACGSTGGPPAPPADLRGAGSDPIGSELADEVREAAAPARGEDDRSELPVLAVARVAGRPISAAELIEAFWQWDTLAVRDQVERLAISEIARQEAERLGLTLPDELVEERYARDVAELEAQVTKSGAATSLEDFVGRRLGLDQAAFLRRYRTDSTRALLEERVVRAHLLASERAELRVIVVEDDASFEAARADLAAGVPFEEVARARSVDSSAAEGGRVPPIVRSERSPLARAAFATPVGSVGGPVVDEESGRKLMLLVEARPEPVVGDWDVLGPAVEASLVQEPVSDPEVWQWRAALEGKYPLDLSPLFGLVGEPAR